MAKIIGTCGHEVDINTEPTAHKDFNNGVNCIGYSVLCDACKENYIKWGYVLETEEECRRWLLYSNS